MERQTKPTLPQVTECLVVPEAEVEAPPYPPAILTDEWAKRIWAWANRQLGVTTDDRTRWQGERDCVRAKRDAGLIR